ncbi:unnamed protein product [Prorocentrum cordatum]|uniref:Uncharacterized protein n=1 Tax=Prorocentrum cordatum TaxID=2364126 RepID=A0ABN9SHD4_9DINO|nr:unnamed protein product [Polarella glacialis]
MLHRQGVQGPEGGSQVGLRGPLEGHSALHLHWALGLPAEARRVADGPHELHCGGQALGLRLYRASDRLKGAATYTHGGKGSGNCSLGLFHELMKGTTVKTKVAQDQSFSFAVKHEVSKGFTWIGGGKYDSKKGDYTCGL